ncbi:MAG: PEP-CTERM sorting domain-containing protein [Verrucomicrobiota bacterium]
MNKHIKAFALALIAATPFAFATNGSDDYQSYSSLAYGNNGGTGLGAHTYLEGTGGGIYLETGGAAITGGKSMGIYSSTGGQALDRSTSPGAFGIYSVSARFNLDNSVAFSGLNLKDTQGSTFGTGELISFGLTPGTGNTSIFVAGSVNQTISLGSEIRGSVIDFQLTFNSTAATYTLGAKFSGAGSYTTVSGSLKDTNGGAAGTGNANFLGFGNFNTGTSQNLIVDNIVIVPEPSAFALLGIGGLALGFIARRRKA